MSKVTVYQYTARVQGVNSEELATEGAILPILRIVIELAGMRLVKEQSFQFPNIPGITHTAILAESSASTHTWPEDNLLLLDIMSCKEFAAEPITNYLRTRFPECQVYDEQRTNAPKS